MSLKLLALYSPFLLLYFTLNTLNICYGNNDYSNYRTPLVIGTWATDQFQQSIQTAWDALAAGESRMSALVNGLSTCERLQCDFTVGWGGSPDERGETTLDALVMDGPTHAVGAVAELRRVRDAARVAWAVLNHTRHTLLVGEKATEFALAMGFEESSLNSNHSKSLYASWLDKNCQPNFWKNVSPDSAQSCGPYKPITQTATTKKDYYQKRFANKPNPFNEFSHDTLGLIVIDGNADISAGTSSNGATFKIPGRVGDSPVPGSGAFVDNDFGAAVATGDGDVMMRFAPSAIAVEYMRNLPGINPGEAAAHAVERVRRYYPGFFGAVVASNRSGGYGAACSGMRQFHFSVNNSPLNIGQYLQNGVKNGNTFVETVDCQQ